VVCPIDGFLATTLGRGELFGESKLLRLPGVEYFGDIVAREGAKVMVLRDWDRLLNYSEKNQLRELLERKYDSVRYTLERRYRLDNFETSIY